MEKKPASREGRSKIYKPFKQTLETMQEPAATAERERAVEDLRERFLFLIEMWASNHGRYQRLEQRTGIPAARWQNVLLDKQMPTTEMLLAVCTALPNMTYWLFHGAEGVKYAARIPGFAHSKPDDESWEWFQEYRAEIKAKRSAKTTKPAKSK